MNLDLVISFLIASVALTLMPGPDNIFVLTESISGGKKKGVSLALGLSSGIIVHTAFAATGVSLLIQSSSLAFDIIKYFGAGYLIYIAYKSAIEKKVSSKDATTLPNGFFKQFKTGFLMNVLNPKVTLFFVAFLPSFITKEGINVTLQMFVLGSMFMLQAFVLFSMIALLSGSLASYLASEKFWIITKWLKVIVLFVLALFLLIYE